MSAIPPADERTLRVLEYPRIAAALADATVTVMGKARARALLPVRDAGAARDALAETSEAAVLSGEAEIPVRGAHDLTATLDRAAQGGTLEAADLLDVAETLAVTRQLRAFLHARRAKAPRLADMGTRLTPLPELEGAIGRALDERGRVRDDASPALRRIRNDAKDLERQLRASLEALVHDAAYARYLQEPLVTTRGDRFVVPVRAEYRAHFPGIVHDASSSGATVFMEPTSLVPLGNRRRELVAAEHEEVLRILRMLSASVGEHAPSLRLNGDALGEIDLAAAKAALAARLRGAPPDIRDGGPMRLREARHPLLVLLRGEESVVPIDIDVGDEFTTLVVTGPNTGGKTVALKTIGLLALMAQAGLHIPAAPGSVVASFDQVHADIGDEQSIEQNLSTFSSHMSAIVEILRRVAPPALVLLDEVGAGTDPTEGVALARAIIEALHRRGVHTVVTTHYNELKLLASTEPGIENGSVEFDTETLQPTYRLRVGLPGRSNALVIAQRLGLDADIVGAARNHLAPEQVAIERVLEDLTRDRQEAERDRAEAALARAAAEAAEARWTTEADRLRVERRRLLAEARRASETIVEQTRRRLDAVLAEVRAAHTESAVRAARDHLRDVLQSLPVAEPAPLPPGAPVQSVEVGRTVYVVPLGRVGIIRETGDARDEVEVEVGALRVRVPRDGLREPLESAAQAADGTGSSDVSLEVRPDPIAVPSAPAVALSLSIVGHTVDEALPEVDRYLDEAVRARLQQVTIIHGKGTGRLRQALHEFLRDHPHAKHFRIGERGEGDHGATVITLAL